MHFFIIDTLSVWLILKFQSMFFTFNLKFLSSAYLSFALKSSVGCFMMDLLIWGPLFSALAMLAMDMLWIATLAALASCVMYSLVFVCLLATSASMFDWFLCFTFESAFLRFLFLSSRLAETAYFEFA